MAHVLADRVLETTTSTGTGVIALAGAVTGFRRFNAACATNDTCRYYIEAVDATGRPSGDYEYGLGTYSGANQLTRTTVKGSSNSGSAVNFAAGTKLVAITNAAPDDATTRAEWLTAFGAYAAMQNQTSVAYTTGGTSSAFTLTPVPAITAYAENQEFDVEFNAASTGEPTLNISAVGAKFLKFRLPGGTLVTCGTLIPSGWRSKVTYDGTDMIVREMPLSAATPAAGTSAGAAGATGTASDAGHAHPPMSGSVIQKVISTDATVLGPLSGAIPSDDTIPQSSEGDLVFSFPAFTPKSASSTLVIHVSLWGSTSIGFAYPTWAVFNSGSANAIGAGRGWPDNGSGNAGGITIIATEAAASTSARTYTVRAGISGGNWYINGNTTGTRRFGGVSFIVGTIEEIAA